MLEHGGAIRAAAIRYGIPERDWIDLSTGINPRSWRPPRIPIQVWRRLPEDDDGLEQAAAEYYGTTELLPTAGSQAPIQALPALRPTCRVGVFTPGYAEHAYHWKRHGHWVEELEVEAIEGQLERLDVLMLSNPNNPTGQRFWPRHLLGWHANLADRGGWLVVDEAFVDATPGLSLAAETGQPGLIVLRSLGKFFGLAGARVGFVLAEAGLRQKLREVLGPWTVNGPGRWVAKRALEDRSWQSRNADKLYAASARLVDVLEEHGLEIAGGTAFFQWLRRPDAERIQDHLAQRGILVRRFADPPSLRFGLPGHEAAWERLDRALAEIDA